MRKIIALLIIISVILACTGCDTYEIFKKYPHYVSDSWYCAEIDFAFFYEYHEDGRMKGLYYPINCNDKIYSVNIAFFIDDWDLVLYSEDDVITPDELLLSGTWKYRGDNLVLHIITDNLFDGKYQELVFIPSSNSPR